MSHQRYLWWELIKLLTIVFVDGILIPMILVWTLFCLLRNENKISLMSQAEIVTNVVSDYAVSVVFLLNPVMYTLLDKSV